MRIKLFTDSDYDGVGCAVLAKLAFPFIDVEYTTASGINTLVREFIKDKSYLQYDKVYITDMSVNAEVAELIDIVMHEWKPGIPFEIIDHHKTAEFLNEYPWCHVQEKNHLGKCSGTSLFYETLKRDHGDNLIGIPGLDDFVENVRRYDTWEWKTIYNDEFPGMMSSLLSIYGREKFEERCLNMLCGVQEMLDETDLLLLELDNQKREKYCIRKFKQLTVHKCNGFTIGVVIADQYISELGDFLAKQVATGIDLESNPLSDNYKNIDFIAIITGNKISYRGLRDDLDLGLIAKSLGGGGHPKSSGSPIHSHTKEKMYNIIFEGINKETE